MKYLRILYLIPAFYILTAFKYANDYIFNGVSIGIDRTLCLVSVVILTICLFLIEMFLQNIE
jgi:hypothetical protein